MTVTFVYAILNTTINALEIGSMIPVFLFWIITLQAHMYYSSFQEDHFKVLVRHFFIPSYRTAPGLTGMKVAVVWYGSHLSKEFDAFIPDAMQVPGSITYYRCHLSDLSYNNHAVWGTPMIDTICRACGYRCKRRVHHILYSSMSLSLT
jgi:hypothetical protein